MANRVETYTGSEWKDIKDVSVQHNSAWTKAKSGHKYHNDAWVQWWPLSSITIGTIAYWPTLVIPDEWALCDGSTVSSTQYPDLAAALGTTWGSGPDIVLPNLVDGSYLLHGVVATTKEATIRKSHLSISSGGLSASTSDTNAQWSGRLGTSTDGDHNHLAPTSGWNSSDSANNLNNWIGHRGGGEGHRVTDGSWNFMTFQNLRNDDHSHSTPNITLNGNGNHSHSWSGTMDTNHSHDQLTDTTYHSFPSPTAVEIDAVTMLPIIYLGAAV